MFRSPPVDLIVILIIVLLIMGPKRLPAIGKGLGHGMREFKEGITGASKHEDEPEAKSAIAPAAAMPESSPEARTSPPAQPVAAPVPPSASSSEPGSEQRP